MIVNWSVLTWSPADSDEFVELGFLDDIALLAIIGVADAITKCTNVEVHSPQMYIEF